MSRQGYRGPIPLPSLIVLTLILLSRPAAGATPVSAGSAMHPAITPPELTADPGPISYVPGEVLLGLREGADIDGVLMRAGFASGNVRRIHDIEPVIDEVRRDLSASSGPAGPYALEGRTYGNLENIPTETLFSAAYERMSPRRRRLYRSFKLRVRDGVSVSDAMRALAADIDVEYAEPNYLATFSLVPNDSRYSEQWAHQNTLAEAGWDVTTGSPSVVVAVVDSGVAYTHEDLVANLWTDAFGNPGRDFVDIDTQSYVDLGYELVAGEDYAGVDDDPSDYNGHGTHVAGIAAAAGDNLLGVAGACQHCRIMPVRAGFTLRIGASLIGALEVEDIASAIVYAADQGAEVVNMSFGGVQSQTEHYAIEYAYNDHGVILVAAAGNTPADSRSFPAAEEHVLAVAATAIDDTRAYYSSFGLWVDVAAPGGNAGKDPMILSTLPLVGAIADPSGYGFLQGTSMAAPYVSGLAGLLLSNYPGLTNADVTKIIRGTTDDPDSQRYIGTGRVNMQQALQVVSPPTADAVITAPADHDVVAQSSIDVTGTASGTNYVLEIADEPYASSWSIVATGSAVADGVLGTLDTTALEIDRTYFLRLRVVDSVEVNDVVSFRYNPSIHFGWPRSTGAPMLGSPAAFDLDGDGRKEIVATTYSADAYVYGGGQIFVWRDDGSDYPGWPIAISDAPFAGGPAVGDLDHDGSPEIVAAAPNGVWAFHGDGSTVAGWPQPNQAFLPPALADLDGDGDLEIIEGADLTANGAANIYVWHHDGSIVAGWPLPISGASGAAIADLDGDLHPEIIVGTRGIESSRVETMQVHVLRADGTPLAGWPQATVGWVKAAPVVGDIDADGELEIVVVAGSGVYLWHSDGTPVSGWPLARPEICINTPPILSDIDQDGDLEILFCDGLVGADFRFAAYHHDAVPVSGWPVLIPPTDEGFNSSFQATTGDIDGDGDIEIVAKGADRLLAWHANGTPVDGFPYVVEDSHHTGTTNPFPVIADVDGDGSVEIVAAGNYDRIYVFDQAGVFEDALVDWPMFQHDPYHTGLYGVCGNGIVEGLEACDDANTIDGDGCDSTCRPTGCGSGAVTGTEQCDDGNTKDGDCCSSACMFEAFGSPCPNADLCDGDEICNGSGLCLPGMPPDCDDGDPCTSDVCDALTGCPLYPEPRRDCRESRRERIEVRDHVRDTRDRLKWFWHAGAPVLMTDLGSPTTTTSYQLCVWDSVAGAPTLAIRLVIPPNANWSPAGSGGYKYHDSSAAFDGVVRARATISWVNAKASLLARGQQLPTPVPVATDRFFAQEPNVTVQLVNSDGMCWTSVFNDARKNTGEVFTARVR